MTCKKLLNDGSIWFNASLIFFPIPFNLRHPPPFHVPPRERIFGVRPASCTAALLLCRRMAAVMACWRDHGHLWPYHPVTCDPIIPGHLRPYYPVTCDPIPLITLTPPAFHHTIVSILLLYLNFPPCVPLYHCLHSTSLFKLPPLRSTIPLSPFYFFI